MSTPKSASDSTFDSPLDVAEESAPASSAGGNAQRLRFRRTPRTYKPEFCLTPDSSPSESSSSAPPATISFSKKSTANEAESFESLAARYEAEEERKTYYVPEAPKIQLPKAVPAPEESAPRNFTSDKKEGTSFHWRDASHLVKHIQSVNSSASWTQDRACFDFSARTRPLLVMPIADWHFGSLGSDYGLIESFTDMIL